MENTPIWVTILVAAMGFGIPLLFLWFGLHMVFKTRRFMANAVTVNATVIGVTGGRTVDHDGTGSNHYIPTYEYLSAKGERIEARLYSSVTRKPAIGDTASLMVDPSEPNVVRNSNVIYYVIGGIFAAIGASVLIVMMQLF